MTKLSAVSQVLNSAGKRFDAKRSAVLSNDMLDAMEMLGSGKGVLFVPKEQNRLEKLTQLFGLYDVAIRESADVDRQLRRALGRDWLSD